MSILDDLVRIHADDETYDLTIKALRTSARDHKAVLLVGDRELSNQRRDELGPTVVVCTPREALTIYANTLEDRPIMVDPSCYEAALWEAQGMLRDAIRQRDVARDNARIYRAMLEGSDG